MNIKNKGDLEELNTRIGMALGRFDFFGHESWRDHIREIIDGDFRVCLSQGINVRMITTETAEALASIQ